MPIDIIFFVTFFTCDTSLLIITQKMKSESLLSFKNINKLPSFQLKDSCVSKHIFFFLIGLLKSLSVSLEAFTASFQRSYRENIGRMDYFTTYRQIGYYVSCVLSSVLFLCHLLLFIVIILPNERPWCCWMFFKECALFY